MNAIIIDDESSSRNTLRNFLSKYCYDIDIVGEADGIGTGLEIIRQNEPEVVFLDVEMKDGTGFDLLGMLQPVAFKVIFITGFDKYALRAFDFSAVDYLLKPLDPGRLIEAVRKLKNDQSMALLQKKLNVLVENRNTIEKIALPATDGLVMVRIRNIIRCESEGNYTRFHLSSGEDYLSTRTLKEYDELFEDLDFFRIHKSHLVNLNYALRYIKGDGGTLIMEDGAQVEVARRRREGLLAALRSR